MLTDLEKNAIRDHYRTISENLPHFRPRIAQREMIAAIANTFSRTLSAEKDDETGDGQNTEDSVNNSDAADRDGSTRSTVEQGITTDSAAGTSSAE